MIQRHLHDRLVDQLARGPAVALLGPRQVGKTTLALEISGARPSIYLDLELNADRAKLTDPEAYLASHENELVILDEVHRAGNLSAAKRADRSRKAQRQVGGAVLAFGFGLAGSAPASWGIAGRTDFLPGAGHSTILGRG